MTCVALLGQAAQGRAVAEPPAKGGETGQAHACRDYHQDLSKLGPGRGAGHDTEVQDLCIGISIGHEAGHGDTPGVVLRSGRVPGECDAQNDHVLQDVDPVQSCECRCHKDQETQLCQGDAAQHDIIESATQQCLSYG